ncbi:hypothetical protein COCNU_12G007440 [Cocos nucifera]|uniref:Uncharacterized protein n=1 Tax=Cocos nucifera TaxID=13894 RepID=A0A8K0IS25_COCNU|nr:hypothetical protein COCNU_12G007440 [Cocos nucifera]
MSERPNRHQRRPSQGVFHLPENFSSFEAAPPMEVSEKKTTSNSGRTSSEIANPLPPSASQSQELKEGISKKSKN